MNEQQPPDPRTCPACGADGTGRLGGDQALRRYTFRRCGGCGHHYLEVGEALQSDLAEAYSDHYAGFRPDARFARFAREFIDKELTPRVASRARILDFGCGSGEFLDAVRNSTYSGRGFDLSKGAIRVCVERGLDAEAGDFFSWLPPEGSSAFDVVTMWDVLEHLPDPARYLQRIRTLLRPGGRLFVKTPRVQSLSVRSVHLVPLLAGPLLQTPGHVQFFGRESLSRLLERTGFRSLEWLPARNIREPRMWGWRSYVRNGVVRTLQRLSGDSNHLVFASA